MVLTIASQGMVVYGLAFLEQMPVYFCEGKVCN